MTAHAIIVAPHRLAADAAAGVLREGGTAIEAMVAAAAAISVVYPHMTSIGGDAFWLIHEPGRPLRAIDASGAAAAAATPAWYRDRGHDAVPIRGPHAANTVAGTVAGWALALEYAQQAWGARIPLSRLLERAITLARDGFPVSRSHARCLATTAETLGVQPGFAERFLPNGIAPQEGDHFRQTVLTTTFEQLARTGLDDFYRGDLAQTLARDLAAAGSPLAFDDLARHRALWARPLTIRIADATVANTPPPTQGVASLAILAVADQCRVAREVPESAAWIHLMVEATKGAFRWRDRFVADPSIMARPAESLLTAEAIARMAAVVDPARAAPWQNDGELGDTTWLGCIDGEGRAVSFIQSLYHEFGSGLVLPSTHINWQNRGASFSLDPRSLRVIAPGRKPFHTLNPALARFDDGRVMVYGTMGGDGQPQTQAAVFMRYAHHGYAPVDAIAAPRWLLGRTWGAESRTLKLESRFDPSVAQALAALGHPVEIVGAYDECMGHAGLIIRWPDGRCDGASDPRSDGAAMVVV